MTNTALHHASRFVEVYNKLDHDDFCKFVDLVGKLDAIRSETRYMESQLKELMDKVDEVVVIAPAIQYTHAAN